ncbi:winged helix-turn-helix transcriptional regulator [Pseudonocardia sulfidoxydans]
MAAALLCERWNLLIIRELYVGARRFNDIHRGLPGLSRTLLSQRLRSLRQTGLVMAVADDGSGSEGYVLTDRGADLERVLMELGSWGVRWSFPEPSDEQLDPHLLMWRMRLGLRPRCLPDHRITAELIFEQNQDLVRGWLIIDGEGSSVCTRHPMFAVDIHARARSEVWYAVWYGQRSWSDALSSRDLSLSGEPDLVRAFPTWFERSGFADEVAARYAAGGRSTP